MMTMSISAAHRHALRAAPQERLNQRGRAGDLLQRGLMWLALAVPLLLLGPRLGYAMVLAGVAALWLQIQWHEQFASLCRQNHPNIARLVPGHLRVLREIAVVLWLLIAALTGLAMGLMTGLGLLWMLAAAATMLIGALFISHVWVATVLTIVLSVFPAFLARDYYDVYRWARTAWDASPQLPVTVAALLLGAWLLCLMLRDGGAAHRRAHARRARSRLASDSSASGRSMLRHTGRIGETLILALEAPLRAWARWLLARARPTPRSVLARADLVLGSHWVQQVGGLAIFLAIAALTLAVSWFGFGFDLWRHRGYAAFGMGIGFTCAALGPVLALVSSLHATRREQALLMLLPGMPRGAALNRHLARRHGIRMLLAWGAATAFLLMMSWGTKSAPRALVFSCCCLPIALLIIGRDWSRVPTPTAARQGFQFFFMFTGGAAGMLLTHYVPALRPLVPPAMIALAVFIALLRWQRVARLPQALPAGRLADTRS